MMGDRRRYSPEGSSRRRKESSRSEYDDTPRMRPGANEYLSSSASSSSSYELIDISRTYPARSGLKAFFTAPSEHKLRKRRSHRLFKLNNSSSSSVNSDLAYGTGYLRKHKPRSVRSRKGKEIDRESGRYSRQSGRYYQEREKHSYSEREKHSYSDRERFSGSERRGNSNAEILAVGAGLAKLARDQNKLDLKNARNGKKPEVYAVKENTHGNNGGSRGLGASRISHGSDTFDEEGWESATDAESDFSVDSRLAFGEENGWGWGKKKHGPLSRKGSVVDPKLFGPNNSLHGIITHPVGFDDVTWTSSSDFGQGQDLGQLQDLGQGQQRSNTFPVGSNDSLSGSQASLQKVYPIPTTDPSRFEAARSSVASGSEPYISSRPGPAPLQHPQPFTPVSQAIYEPSYTARSESGGILKKTQPPPSRTKSLAEAALVGVAGAAVGAAIVSNRKDDRKDRYQDDEIREEDRLKRRDSDKRESKDERRRGKRDSPDRDDRKDKRREKDRPKESSRYSSDESRREKKREKRRESGRDDGKDEKREKRREERRSARSDVSGRDDRYDDRRTKSEAAISTVSTVDPFMFQVDDNDFPTPTAESSLGHRRIESVPTVVTVEREPDFTRKRSTSIKELPSDYKPDSRNEYPWDEKEQRQRDSRDQTFQNAESIYQETEHSTAPISAAAIGAAVGAVGALASESSRTSRSDKRRDERRSGRSDYDDRNQDTKPRGREPERDPIQEEADRAYREIVMARKIASQVIRSRSASPDPSVVKKYDEQEEPEIIRIVTPPGMEDHKKKGPYDAPNADFRPDYEIEDPRLLRHFSIPSINQDRSNPEVSYLKRDPDATKPRPLLNLVHPTPTPSPLPEKQAARSETSRSSKSKDRNDSNRSETARSEPARSSKSRDRDESSRSETGRSSKSRDREDTTRSESAWSEPARSSKSKDREDTTRSETARSEPARSSKSKDREKTSSSEVSRSSKSKDREKTSSSEISRSSKSRDRDESSRSETAWSEPPRSNKAKDREEQVRSSASDVVSSPTSKGVTWGQNETKHFEVESPSEHKEDFISDSQVKALEDLPESKQSTMSKFGGWGAIAAGIVGAGAGATAASSSETSKKSTSEENEKKQGNPYEYRGVVVEPESPPRRRSPPSAGPKPTKGDSSHVPGAFDDDLDFTATVAAGLQDTGFDPNIVIEDPTFRRRDSPPGSNEPGVYRTPYAETVSDLGAIPTNASEIGSSQGFVMDEVASTRDWPSVSPDRDDSAPKLSKKEQKKRDKAAKRQSDDMAIFEETPPTKVEEPDNYFEPTLSKKEKKRIQEAKRQSSLAEDIMPIAEPSTSRGFVEEPESYAEPSKKSKKKSKRESINFDDVEEASALEASRDGRKVSVPVDAFDDLQNEEDEWAQPKSKKKSKRDSDRYDSPARSVPLEASSELSRSSSKKSKDRSKRKSVDQYEPDPAEVSLPPSTPSETSRDGDHDDRKSRKASSRDSGIFGSTERDDSRSVVSSRYDDEPRKSKKKSRSSTKDDFDDTRSVASAPAGDEDSKRGKKDKKSSGGFFGLFGSKSESGARDDSPKRSKDDFEDVKKKKKSKRSSMPDASSLYGDLGATSVNDLSRSVSNGHRSSKYDDDLDYGVRSDGERKKTRSRAESTSSKKDSFLGKADTLGAGVGIAGAAVAIAAQHHQQSKADNAYDEPEHTRSSRYEKQVQMEDELDPEIKRRHFRPSIDPQYGDLLPLPPSRPTSPNVEPLDNLPDLPDSGPETPEAERLHKGKHKMRRSIHDTPTKSPSHSAVPLKFIMGNRSNPSSPGVVRSSPAQSPSIPSQDSTAFGRNRHRPTHSWDSAREYKPLYLVESNRRSSQILATQEENPLPELPPSQSTSRSSSQLDLYDAAQGLGLDFDQQSSEEYAPTKQLSIDTGLASSDPSAGLLDSQQSTPKAGVTSHDLEERFQSLDENASKAIATAGLVSTIGYFASSPSNRTTKENWMDDLPSAQRQPSPVNSMTKDRSSYLLRSSPISMKDDIRSEEQAMDSPLRTKSTISDHALHSTEEPESRDIFESGKDPQHDASVEDSSVAQLPHEAEQVHDEAEPADEPSFTKSKKDKKKDKKKGKGLSRSSTQDDTSLPQVTTSVDLQPPTPGDIEPEEEFSTTKSKKDKKKDKKKGKSTSSWEAGDEARPLVPESQEIVEEPVVVNIEPSEEFSMPKSKKDKKKGKSISSWEAEDKASTSQPLETPLVEENREIDEEIAPVDVPSEEFSMPKSKKDNKKDKKKEKSISSWEPEEPTPSQPIAEFLPESSQEIVEEPPPTADAGPSEELTSVSKKNKKKDKKKGKSTGSWEPEQDESKPSATQEDDLAETVRDLIEETVSVPDDFRTPETKKSKKEKRKSVTWQADEELAVLEPTSPPKLDLEQESAQEVPAADDFESFSTKKSKKGKKGKSTVASEPEAEVEVSESSSREIRPEDPSSEPATPEFEDAQEFVMPDSKKNKKKGKKSQSLGPEETFDTGLVRDKSDNSTEKSATVGHIEDQPLPDKAVEEPEQIVIPGSKKNKKKSKKSQAWEEDLGPPVSQMDAPAVESFAPIPAEVAVEESTMPSSKKGKKKSRKSQTFDVDEEARPESLKEEEEKSTEANKAPEVLSDKATILDVPTPATPFATAEEFPASPNSGYFPSAASLHSPEKLQVSEDPQSQGYFPSSMAILPAAAAGLTALAANRDEKDVARPDDPDSQATASETVDQKPALDGLAAGYDNDQLSLARQLQEEFGSGSKKSKKDKKKRQSLPSTPDPESSRSRTVDDTADSHPRARSLSIGPAAESSERKNLYSEDQLELARQLKADFDKGSKKSKKDKKKRGDSLGPSTRDNAFDQGLDDPTTKGADVQDNAPTLGLEDETPKGDGLAAGYQEEQLSLARQLQAEFGGSGSKKSKKDKKRRSTSQTPLEQETPDDDYFGASAQAPVLDAPYSEEPANIPEASSANETIRDGLAVGYKEEQLELARQLKEEFGSGSKSKKGKKDKKRQSLGRSNTEDDFSSSSPAGEAEGSLERDAPAPLATEAGPTDPQIAGPEDELAFVAKKSKKDKKGKKRENLIRTTTEESLPSEAQGTPNTDVPQPETVETRDADLPYPEVIEIRDADVPQPEIVETRDADVPQPEIVQEAAPENVQPVDDFEFISKKSKKDKKSKKRDSLLRGTTDDNLISNAPAKESDALNVSTSPPETVEEPSQESNIATPADEFEFTAKKSKKDKKSKKRESSKQSTPDENVVSEAPVPSASEFRELDISQPEPSASEDVLPKPEAEPIDDFAFTTTKSKKDKKGKKRESLIQSTPDENVVPEAQVPSASELREPDISQPETSQDILPEPQAAEPADEFALTPNKSKKDKKGKKRESLIQSTPDENVVPEAQVPSASESQEPDISQPETSQEILPEPQAAEPEDEFALAPKKSKKDKKGKKKDSFAPTTASDKTAPDETPPDETLPVETAPTAPIESGKDIEALHNSRDVDSEDVVAIPSELPPAEDEWAVPGKKSKKDKKKRQSLETSDAADQLHSDANPAPNPSSEEPSIAVSPAIEPVSEPADDYGSTSKISKKGNKKRQSLLRSSTFDETPEQQFEDKNLEVASSSQDIKDIESLPSAEQDDGFDVTSKKSKKDKKKDRRSTQEPSTTEDVSTALQEPVGIEQGGEVTSQPHDPVPSLEDPTPALDSSSHEPSLDEGPLAQPALDATQEEPDNLFDEFSFSKKSKKDKKKRKDSSKHSSEEVPGILTPLDPPAETKEQPTESSTSKEAEQEKPSVVAEILDPAPKVDAEGTGVWDAFSTKKSKKDKKKKNISRDTSGEPSGISTPLDSAPQSSMEVSEANSQSENVLDSLTLEKPPDVQLASEAPATPQGVAEEPEQDEFFSHSKKSKKDKKKRKSGLSTPIETTPIKTTPIETVPETSVSVEEPFDQEQSTSEQQVDEPIIPPSAQETVEEPEQHEWASLSTKKSKKDKKKRQSGLSTPADEDTKPVGELVSVVAPLAAIATKEIIDESSKNKESPASVASQDTIQEPDENGSGSFSTKKSKKDKRLRKSGLATPIEDIVDKSGPSEETIASESQIFPEPTQDVVEDSKLEDLPTSTETREIVDEPSHLEEPSVPATLQEAEEPVDEWSSSAKKSKKDKKKRKSGLLTPVEVVSEKPIETAESSTPAQEILEEPAKSEESALTQSPEVLKEPVDDRPPISRKHSKKDKKRKSGLSTPAEELSTESFEPGPYMSAATPYAIEEPAKNEEPIITAPAQEATEEPVDEWASISTKKSKKDKKDKKRKSGPPTPAEEMQEQIVAVEEPRDLSIDSTGPPPSGEIESHFIEAPDKPKDEEIEGPTEQDSGAAYAQEFVEEPVNLEVSPLPEGSRDPAQAPGDELGSFSTKNSKKDKKRKSGLSTPQEETSTSTKPQKYLETEGSIEQPSSDPLGVQTVEEFAQPLSEKLDDKDGTIQDDGFGFAKKSKKDKKGKRGSRLDTEADATNILPKDSPLTTESSREQGPSIAAEHLVVNPVDIEQMSPSLKDKSRDTTSASLPTSEHFGSEDTDTFPTDLSRKPSKKDKRKRQATLDATIPGDVGPAKSALTSWADEVEEAEVERKLPVIEDIAKDESLSHIALTTEASPVDDFLRPTKKGKKGKKKNTGSIGSPSMAESFRPPIGEDIPKDENSSIPGLAAAGAAALAGAAILSKSGGKESEPSTSASGASTPARKLSKKEKRKMSIDHRAPRDDIFDDPALWEGADPKEFEESRGQEKDYDGDDGFWSPPREEQSHADLVASHEPSEIDRELKHPHVETSQTPLIPPTTTTSNVQQPVSTPLELTDIPLLSPQNASTPSESISQSQHREVDFEEQPIESTPSRKSRYNTGFSDLPVVREESPVRHESDLQVKRGHHEDDANRDSAFVTESPIPPQGAFADVHDEHVRDSGVHMHDISPAGEVHARAPVSSSDDAIASLAWPQVDEEAETVAIDKSLRPKVVTDKHRREESSRSSHDLHGPKEDRNIDFFQAQRPADERVDKHHDEKRSSIDLLPSQKDKEEKHTSLHRTQTIHGSAEERARHHEQDIHPSHREEHAGLHRTDTIHGSRQPSQGGLVKQRVQRLESSDNLHSAKPKVESDSKQSVPRIKSPDSHRSSKPKEEKYAELGQAQIPKAERPKISNESAIAAGTAAIGAAGLGFAAARQLSGEKRPDSAQSHKSISNINRLRTPDPKFRSDSANSHRSGTPPLRRSDRKISGDLRSLSQRSQLDLAKEAELAAPSNSSSTATNPQANEGRVRAKDMADVYDGFGEGRMGSPRSPTRPHSMRRRQSMQVLDLESKLEQLAAENRMLAEAKAQAERTLQVSGQGSISVVEKDAEIDSLKRTLDWLQNEVTRLTEVNDGLASANATIGQQHSERYGTLEAEHAQATRELQETRDAHRNLSGGMEGIVRNEVQRSVQEKDEEIAQLRAQLESAKEQIREMQRQILASKAGDSDFLTIRDEDYFDNACQQLCQHVQQWVLRFSKFSDMRACRLTSEINNDKTIDRLDNAILDGSDVDNYLADRIKRRDVFMSMTMTMVWEFIFTRYLFGMDREQRQKLKSLEKLLSEVGPAAAVHQWRAITLTLLSKRDAFIEQREQDTEAVVHAILETLSEILPPPSHLEAQIDEQLKRVMKAAVDLSIEMRTQRAEYMMLPPLQPEYDANGDLASKVSFNAALMNERSGDTVSNEELEAQKAVVRVVLFPLVVKKGDDSGEGDEEIVVCPAQVLVAKPKKSVRVFSPEDMAANHSRMSLQSSMPGGEGSVF